MIVGAGMAGLGAAWNFKRLGFEDFVIIEAAEKPGGRIETVYVDEHPLDLGAQWIHGKDNALYTIASSNAILSEMPGTIEGSGIFIRNDGVVFDEFLVKKVDWEVGEILEKCRTFLHEPFYPKSVGEYLESEFSKYLETCENHDLDMLLQLYDWHVRFQTIDNSCLNLNTVSAKYWGSYICTDEIGYYNLKDGYQSLVNVIVNRIPSTHFVFNAPISAVDYDKSPITLRTTDNKIITCNHLILTPSLRVLKESISISPAIPTSLKQSVENIGFYGIGKIFLVFNWRWWGDSPGFQLLWNHEDGLEDSEKWFRCLTGFENNVSHPKVLMGMIGGEGLAAMERLDEKEVGRVCVKHLRKFLSHFEVPEPQKVIRLVFELENPGQLFL